MDKQKLISPVLTSICIIVALFIFGKFGPGLPLSVSQITTNKDQPFMVTGDGKVIVKPDTAEINVGLTANAKTVSQVQSKSNQIINTVTAELKKLGISPDDIQTTNYNINPDYSNEPIAILGTPEAISSEKIPVPPNAPASPKIVGYSLNVNLTIKVRDLSKVNQVVDTATANGANQISGINFTADKPEQFQSQARKLAIADAKKKASELAGEAGITLGKVIGVSENPSYFPRPYELSAKMAGDTSSSQTQLNPGSTEISTQVTLSYETR
jgi:uncharacterized protein YggE